MKIVHVINYFQHQLGYQEYYLAKEHAKAGHDVYVITSNKYFPFPDYDNTLKNILGEREFKPREESIDGIKVIRLKGKLEQPARRIWLKGLLKKIREIKPDIIISHGESTYSTAILSLMLKFSKFKLITDSHTHYTEYYKKDKSFKTKIILFFFRNLVWKNKKLKIIAVTNQTKVFLNREYEIDSDKMNIIPLGTDTEMFCPDLDIRKSVRNELNISDNEILIIYTGKIVQSKNPALIIEACSGLFNKYNLKIIYIGSVGKEYSDKFNRLKKDFDKYIIHHEAVPNSEIHKYYQAADIGIWPKEASMSSVDAVSCGLPVIISDYLGERISNQNGIGIKENNLESLKKAILELVSDKKLLELMGKNGRLLAEKHFDWKYISQQFIELALK